MPTGNTTGIHAQTTPTQNLGMPTTGTTLRRYQSPTTPVRPVQPLDAHTSIAPTNEIERQQAIENALSAALWHIRHGTDHLSIQAATGRAASATRLLQHACEASASGRA